MSVVSRKIFLMNGCCLYYNASSLMIFAQLVSSSRGDWNSPTIKRGGLLTEIVFHTLSLWRSRKSTFLFQRISVLIQRILKSQTPKVNLWDIVSSISELILTMVIFSTDGINSNNNNNNNNIPSAIGILLVYRFA